MAYITACTTVQAVIEKCKVLHIGYNNKCSNYFIDHMEVQSADEETNLGVVVHNTLKVGNQ